MGRKSMWTLAGGMVVLVSTVALQVSLSGNDKLRDGSNDLATRANSVSDDRDDPISLSDGSNELVTRANPVSDESDDPFGPAVPATVVAPPRTRQTAELRQRFVELTAKRAQRMTDDELGRAVEEIAKTITDQDTAAETELEKASAQLKAVVEKFAGTPSAERAGRALEAMKARPTTKLRSPNDLGDDDAFSDSTVPTGRTPIMPSKKPLKR